jgi:hypothetical protein
MNVGNSFNWRIKTLKSNSWLFAFRACTIPLIESIWTYSYPLWVDIGPKVLYSLSWYRNFTVLFLWDKSGSTLSLKWRATAWISRIHFPVWVAKMWPSASPRKALGSTELVLQMSRISINCSPSLSAKVSLCWFLGLFQNASLSAQIHRTEESDIHYEWQTGKNIADSDRGLF